MKENEIALDHIQNIIENINNKIQENMIIEDIAYVPFTYRVRVSIGKEFQVLLFEKSIIDDLEVAIEKHQGTEYFATLDSSVRFTIYISLGQLGLLGNFLISDELINEKRDWIKAYKIDTKFDKEMTDVLFEGLNDILVSLNSQSQEHKRMKIDGTEIEENEARIEALIRYYNDNKHLNTPGAEIKNLQFLKAAAVNQIVSLEKLRNKEKRPTTWRALNSKIYDLVKELRNSPFLAVQLPSFIDDIVATRRG